MLLLLLNYVVIVVKPSC